MNSQAEDWRLPDFGIRTGLDFDYCNCGVGICLQALWCMIFGFVVGLGLMSVVYSAYLDIYTLNILNRKTLNCKPEDVFYPFVLQPLKP